MSVAFDSRDDVILDCEDVSKSFRRGLIGGDDRQTFVSPFPPSGKHPNPTPPFTAGSSIQSYLLFPIFLGLSPYLFSTLFGAENFWMEFSFLALVLFWLYLNSTVPWNLYSICVSKRQNELASSSKVAMEHRVSLWQVLEITSIIGLFATPFIAAYGVIYFQNYYSDRFGIGLLSTFNIHLFVLTGLLIPLRYFFGVGYPTRITHESATAFAPRKDAAVLPLPPTYPTSSTAFRARNKLPFDELAKRISRLEKEFKTLQTTIYSLDSKNKMLKSSPSSSIETFLI